MQTHTEFHKPELPESLRPAIIKAGSWNIGATIRYRNADDTVWFNTSTMDLDAARGMAFGLSEQGFIAQVLILSDTFYPGDPQSPFSPTGGAK